MNRRRINRWLIGAVMVALFSPSCQKLRQENRQLQKEVQDLKQDAVGKHRKHENELVRVKKERDSLFQQTELLKSASTEGFLANIDSLQREVVHQHNLLSDCTAKNQQAGETVRKLQARVRALYAIPGNEATQVEHNRTAYDCYTVDLRRCTVQFYWKDEKTRQPIRSLRRLAQMLEEDGKTTLLFATNAGMYTPTNAPQGLFIQNSRVLTPIDRKKEEHGNFYLQPNGIFLIDTGGVPQIVTTDNFTDDLERRTRFATQSGPMVVVDGVINTKFKIGSDNLNIRSGVGILPDGRAVFIISNKPVNFYDFATVFKDKFNCSNALYLDGAISEMYLPEINRLQDGGNFGPIIGITKK
ncbi:MAG: phosphodiester glycosidase family protein [Saprospiraceae bacterium]